MKTTLSCISSGYLTRLGLWLATPTIVVLAWASVFRRRLAAALGMVGNHKVIISITPDPKHRAQLVADLNQLVKDCPFYRWTVRGGVYHLTLNIKMCEEHIAALRRQFEKNGPITKNLISRYFAGTNYAISLARGGAKYGTQLGPEEGVGTAMWCITRWEGLLKESRTTRIVLGPITAPQV